MLPKKSVATLLALVLFGSSFPWSLTVSAGSNVARTQADIDSLGVNFSALAPRQQSEFVSFVNDSLSDSLLEHPDSDQLVELLAPKIREPAGVEIKAAAAKAILGVAKDRNAIAPIIQALRTTKGDHAAAAQMAANRLEQLGAQYEADSIARAALTQAMLAARLDISAAVFDGLDPRLIGSAPLPTLGTPVGVEGLRAQAQLSPGQRHRHSGDKPVPAVERSRSGRVNSGASHKAIAAAARPKSDVGEEDDEDTENDVHPVADRLFLEADYGVRPPGDSASKLVNDRLASLLHDVPVKRRPKVKVLASNGVGINAMAFSDNTILITPEMLRFVETVEELDFILLHEANHVLRHHHKRLGESDGLGSIGMMRFAEYEADMAAFLQMAEESRGTNPLGAIRVLERIRDQVKKGNTITWDVAHGDISDRLLNMKTASRLLDLLGLDRDLVAMPATVSSGLGEIKTAVGSLYQLLRQPPANEYRQTAWDDWRQAVAERLDRADFIVLTQCLGVLYHDVSNLAGAELTKTQQMRLQSLLNLIKEIAGRWNAQFQAAHPGIDAKNRALAQAIVLETEASIPFLTRQDATMQGLLAKTDVKLFSNIAKEVRSRLRTGLRFSAEGLVLVDKLGHPAQVNAGRLMLLAGWTAQESLLSSGEEDASVEYLQEAARCVEEINRRFPEKSGLYTSVYSGAWAQIVVEGVFSLMDSGEWESQRDAYIAQVRAGSPFKVREVTWEGVKKFLSGREEPSDVDAAMADKDLWAAVSKSADNLQEIKAELEEKFSDPRQSERVIELLKQAAVIVRNSPQEEAFRIVLDFLNFSRGKKKFESRIQPVSATL